jgi:polysaccharide deacetylase family protein (PEP-CTERM system associated)
MPFDTTRGGPGARIHALSVDVEDYFQVEAFADHITPEMWPQWPSRVRDNTLRVLELFARYGAKATFFIVGQIAEQQPSLVREIISAGHEIGCHSYRHCAIWRMTPQGFRQDTTRAVAAIEQAAGTKVLGYRAPTFSVVQRTLWAIEILAEQGFLYDASVYPIRHDLYGMPDAPRFLFRWKTPHGLQLYEFPSTTVRLSGHNLPAGGGGYLRILPLWYSRWAINRVATKENAPAVVYFHPWELDPRQPRIPAGWKSRIRHYTNLKSMEKRLVSLLSTFQFAPMDDVLGMEIANGTPPTRRVTMVEPEDMCSAAAGH